MTKIIDLPTTASTDANTYVPVYKDGKTQKVPATALGGGGSGGLSADFTSLSSVASVDGTEILPVNKPTGTILKTTIQAILNWILARANTWSGVQTFSTLTASNVREKITTVRTYYVRTDGSDVNNGLTNTAGGAFLTIQKAVDTVAALDNGGYLITISIADGTYGAFSLKSYVGSQAPKVVGNTTTPSNVVISATNGAINAQYCGAWNLSGLKVQSTSGYGLYCVGAGTAVTLVDTFEFGACGSQHMISTDDARLNIACPWRVAGNCAAHINTVRGASVLAFAQTCTLVGTPALGYFVFSETASDVLIQSITFTGSATGKRYDVQLNAVVQTYGAGATYFPGNVAGTTATGGQYS